MLQSKGITPSYVVGHSLGEYSAHVAAGTLSFADAVRTVRNRGRYMQEAVPVGVGAMAAILALAAEKVEEICAEAAQGEICQAANLNSPGPDGDLGQQGGGGTRGGVSQATRRKESRDAAGQRSLPLCAHAACARQARDKTYTRSSSTIRNCP